MVYYVYSRADVTLCAGRKFPSKYHVDLTEHPSCDKLLSGGKIQRSAVVYNDCGSYMDEDGSDLSAKGRKLRKTIWFLVTFFGGGVLGPVVEKNLSLKFGSTDALIYITVIAFIAILALSLWLIEETAKAVRRLTRENANLTKRLAEKNAEELAELTKRVGTVRYIDDPTDDTENTGDANRVYAELKEAVCGAQSEILALSLAAVGDLDFSPNNAGVRKNYFDAILERVSNSRNFRYARVLQIPESRWNEDIRTAIGDMMVEHAGAAVRQASTALRRDVTMKKIKTQRLTGFVVVDRKTLIVVIGGLTDRGHPYHKGLFIFERPLGDPLVGKYISYFEFLNGHRSTLPLGETNRQLPVPAIVPSLPSPANANVPGQANG